jgi:hypothetical protein
MLKAMGQFFEGVGMAFLAVAVAPILAISKLVVAFSSFINYM